MCSISRTQLADLDVMSFAKSIVANKTNITYCVFSHPELEICGTHSASHAMNRKLNRLWIWPLNCYNVSRHRNILITQKIDCRDWYANCLWDPFCTGRIPPQGVASADKNCKVPNPIVVCNLYTALYLTYAYDFSWHPKLFMVVSCNHAYILFATS